MKLRASFPDGRDIDRILCNELTEALPTKLYVDYDGSIRVYRQGQFFAEVAHILIDSDTKVRPYYRNYVPGKIKSLIDQTIAHSLETRSLDILKPMLSDRLPQEWLISESTQTTCFGPLRFLRVDTEKNSTGKRQLVCLIHITPEEIVVFASNISWINVKDVIHKLKVISVIQKHFHGRCLTATECPLCCEVCPNAKEFYK